MRSTRQVMALHS